MFAALLSKKIYISFDEITRKGFINKKAMYPNPTKNPKIVQQRTTLKLASTGFEHRLIRPTPKATIVSLKKIVTPQFPKQHLLSNERLSLAVSAATAAVAKQQAAKEQKARNAASFSSSSSLASPSSPPPSPPFSSSTSSSPPSSSEHTTTNTPSPPRQYMGVTDLWSDLGQNEMKEMKEEEKRRKEMSKVHNKKKRYDEKAIQVMAQSNNYTNQEITKEIRRRQMNGVAGKPKKYYDPKKF